MKYNIFSYIILGSLLLIACSDMDEMKPEGGATTEEQITEAVSAVPERVAADLAGIFSYAGKQYCAFPSSTRDDDFGLPATFLSQDLNGADMVCDNSGYNWFSVASEYTDRNPNYANPFARYANYYNQLKLANDLIMSIDPETDNKELQYYIGQAKAVRAFDFLGLAPYFQFNYQSSKDKPCIPLVLPETPDYSNNPRATVEEVYAQIMKDLNEAITLLEGYERSDKTKIDQQVAYGIRARANLNMGNWAEAAADAEKALAGYTPYTRAEVSTPTFCRLSEHSWIWGILIEADKITKGNGGMPSWSSKLASFSAAGYAAGAGCYKRINPILYDKIPESDVRKGWWVDEDLYSPLLETITWEGKTGIDISTLSIPDVKLPFVSYTNVKFGIKGGIGSTTNDGDWCLMRAEEMILIQAEGLAMSGNLTAGKKVLEDFIKGYRDENYICEASSPETFQTEVWKQRRIELWGEGFAMYDIMRLNKPVVRFKDGDISIWPDAFAFNIQPNDGFLLMRFPQRETNNNKGVPPTENNEGSQPVAGQNSNLTDGVTD